jgi:hypothetical protein
MPLRRLDEEFDREESRSVPEPRQRRSKNERVEEVIERADAREGVRQDGREDSRGSSTPEPVK